MKKNIKDWLKVSALILVSFTSINLFQNCGSSSSSGDSSQFGDNQRAPSGNIAHASSYIVEDGERIAQVLGVNSDIADIFIPSVNRYARVSVLTGEYQENQMYFRNDDCTGDRVALSFVGESGKAIIYSRGAYYLVKGVTREFQYQGISWVFDIPSINNRCQSFSQPTDTYTPGYYVEEVSRPYDFKSIAPLEIVHK